MADIEQREKEFIKQVQEVARMIYTKEMISRFCNFWTEADRAPGKRQKMRFEKEKVFQIKKRLITWARNNYDGIQCYLSQAEVTIAKKRFDFSVSLEHYLDNPKSKYFNNGKPKYSSTELNSFFSFWAMPENKPNPEYLKWEKENFWSLETKLKQWHDRNLSQTPFK